MQIFACLGYSFVLQLCKYLASSESKSRRALGKYSFAKGIRKQKRSGTPPEDLGLCEEARYNEQEETVAKRTTDCDIDYEDTSSPMRLSE